MATLIAILVTLLFSAVVGLWIGLTMVRGMPPLRKCSLLLADRDTDPEWIMAFNAALDELDREFPNGQTASRLAVPVSVRDTQPWQHPFWPPDSIDDPLFAIGYPALTSPDLTRSGGSPSSATSGTLIPVPPGLHLPAFQHVSPSALGNIGGAVKGAIKGVGHVAMLAGAAVLLAHTSRKSW